MLPLLALSLLVYMNVRLAKGKGLNPFLWGGLTLLAFFLAYLFLGSIYIAIMYKGVLAPDAIKAWLISSPLAQIMLAMLGIGGVLIVRFILERKADRAE